MVDYKHTFLTDEEEKVYCPNPSCRRMLPDDVRFCKYCGHEITHVPTGPLPSSYTVATPLSQAWADYKASSSKGSIALKLALFQFVPFVGQLVMDGYVYTWGKEASLGKKNLAPAKIIRPGVLDSGLYILGVSAILGILLSLVAGCLMLIQGAMVSGFAASRNQGGVIAVSALFFLVSAVIYVFVLPFIRLLCLRAALCGRVRSGLAFSHAWSMAKAEGKLGKLLTSFWGPQAAVLGVALLVVLLYSGIVAALGIGSLGSLSSGFVRGSSAALASSAGALIGMLFALIPLTILFLFAIFYIRVSADMVTVRALGYWMRDFRPETWDEYRMNSGCYSKEAL